MTDPLVHIGLHRTGSTWMQKSALPHEGIPLEDIWPDRVDLANRVVIPTEDAFEEDAPAIAAFIEARGERVRNAGRVPVISHERLSGNPSSGAYDMVRNAERIERVAPGARILIVLREQQSHLESIWCQAVRIGHYSSARDFLRPHAPGDFRTTHFTPSYLRYDRVVAEYVRRFGRDRVLAIDFERLRRDPTDHMGAICRFMGTTPPESVPIERKYARPSVLEADLLRRGNLLHLRSTLNPGPPFESARLHGLWRRGAAFAARCAPRWWLERKAARLAGVVTDYLDRHDDSIRTGNLRLRDEFGVELMSDLWRV